LYSVVASTVARRRREIGIRAAMGASRPAVIVLVVTQGIRLVLAGTTGGLAAALGASKLLAGLVAGASSPHWRVLTSAAVAMIAISLAACVIPASRACGITPAVALRDE